MPLFALLPVSSLNEVTKPLHSPYPSMVSARTAHLSIAHPITVPRKKVWRTGGITSSLTRITPNIIPGYTYIQM